MKNAITGKQSGYMGTVPSLKSNSPPPLGTVPTLHIVHNCRQYKFLTFAICEHFCQLSFVNNNTMGTVPSRPSTLYTFYMFYTANHPPAQRKRDFGKLKFCARVRRGHNLPQRV